MIGGMQPVLTPLQMATAEAGAISSGIAVDELMARAGGAVARAVLDVGGRAYGLRVAVVCGKGNNGGDGFVAAHRLASFGAYPVVLMLHPVDALTGASAAAFSEMRGVRVRDWSHGGANEVARADVVVDAIVGTGTRGPLGGPAADAVAQIRTSGRPVVSVDVPSGVDPLTGWVTGDGVEATLTVTMGALKTGMLLQPGASYLGHVDIADIGIPPTFLAGHGGLVTDRDVREVIWKRPPTAHKRSVGKVLVVGGSRSMAGAAYLSARGALRGGAGFVKLAVPGSVRSDVVTPELLCVGLPETSAGTIEPSAVVQVVELSEEMDAVVLGPGITTHPETVEFVRKCVSAIPKPLVLDADGLNAIGADAALLSDRSSPTILTPHVMELARLVASQLDEVEPSRLRWANHLAETTGSVVLSKGAPTVVTDGSFDFFVTSGSPVLATAGTGDVLSGVTAAFACKLDPVTAAWSSAHIHGLAGRIASSDGRTILASEVADAIGEAILRCTGSGR